MIHIQNHRKDACGGFVGFRNHEFIVITGIQANGLIKFLAGHIPHIHGGKDRQQEKTTPETCHRAAHRVRLRLHQGVEKVPMAVFILAPSFKEIEDGEDFALRMLFKMTEDCNIPPVANLFREVGGIKDERWPEGCIVFVGGEETQVKLHPKVRHGLVEKSGMTRLVTGHILEALRQQGIFLFDAATQLLIEKKAGKLRRATLLQKLHKHAPGLGIQLVRGAFKFLVADEMVAIVILAKLLADGFQLRLVGPQIHGRHGVKVRGVEPGGEDGVLDRRLHPRAKLFKAGGGG